VATNLEVVEGYLQERFLPYANLLLFQLDFLPYISSKVPSDELVGDAGMTWELQTLAGGQVESGAYAGRGPSIDPEFVTLSQKFYYHRMGIDIEHAAWMDMDSSDHVTAKGYGTPLVKRQSEAQAGFAWDIQSMFWMNGSGIRAVVKSKGTDSTGIYLELYPYYSNRTLYPNDACKLVKKGKYIDVGGMTGDLNFVANPAVNQKGLIRDLDYLNHKIYFAAGTDFTDVQVGDFVFLHNQRPTITWDDNNKRMTLGTAHADRTEFVGLMGIFGDCTGWTETNPGAQQGNYSLYGKTIADFAEHKSYCYPAAADLDNTGWDFSEYKFRTIEENAVIAGVTGGADGYSGKEPVEVDGREIRAIEFWMSPNTAQRLTYDAARTRTAGGTAFHEVNPQANDQKIGMGVGVVYNSKYFGLVPCREFKMCPDGLILGVRVDQMRRAHKGPSWMYWKPAPGGGIFENPINITGEDRMSATMRSYVTFWVKARCRGFVIRNLKVGEPT
jgi:hypothetical protein